MIDRNIPVTEDELHAYVDNELPVERRGDVEAWLAAHPDDAERVQSWRAMAEALHARYDAVIDEAVPARLEIERLVREPRRWVVGAVAATLAAFVVGGGMGWVARGATAAAPSVLQAFTVSERNHLQQWLTKRCGWVVRAPELTNAGLKLVGGRLLPSSAGPASFMMYESATGERFTIYTAKSSAEPTQMRFTEEGKESTLFWADDGVVYAVVSTGADRGRLNQVAQAVYDQMEKKGG